MNAVDLLMQDHRKMEQLLSDFQSSASDENQEQLLQEIQVELLAHTEAEERAFYPRLRDAAAKDVKRSIEEHTKVRRLLMEMPESDVGDEDFDRRFSSLVKSVHDHIRQEEAPDGLMETARQRLSEEELSEVAGEIRDIKNEIQSDMAA